MSGRDAIEKMLRDSLIVYEDGTPRTKHVTTNVAIEVDEEAVSAGAEFVNPTGLRFFVTAVPDRNVSTRL